MSKIPCEVTLKHIGINAGNSETAEQIAALFAAVFGLEYRPGNSSVFAGSIIEVTRRPFPGQNGHIALGVDAIEEVEEYFSSIGHPFVESTIKRNSAGQINAVYVDGDFGGFAVHLLKN